VTDAQVRRSIRFPLGLSTAALVALAVALVLATEFLVTREILEDEVDDGIGDELEELAFLERDDGFASLMAEIEDRSRARPLMRRLYVLSVERFEPVRGNLKEWPEALEDGVEPQTLSLEVPDAEPSLVRRVRMVSITFEGGARLAVGRDVTERERFVDVLGATALGSFGLAVVLALAFGLTISHNLLGRVERMNRTVLRILAGRGAERVPVKPRQDEFDVLAAHFNQLLDENERLIDRMRQVTNDVAHDLRSPLSRMRTHIEAALSETGEHGETLHALLDETNAILETFNALLHIAQIESGVVREHMEPLDLATLARDAADLYQPAAEEAGVALETHLVAGLQVRAHRHLLAQALTNLIDNAIKYGGPNGRVEISTRLADGAVRLCVADRGEGIPAEDRERVMERFVRLDASRKRPGTGLGLAFVAAVAELHDARLSLEDNAPGLRVTLSFPSG